MARRHSSSTSNQKARGSRRNASTAAPPHGILKGLLDRLHTVDRERRAIMAGIKAATGVLLHGSGGAGRSASSRPRTAGSTTRKPGVTKSKRGPKPSVNRREPSARRSGARRSKRPAK